MQQYSLPTVQYIPRFFNHSFKFGSIQSVFGYLKCDFYDKHGLSYVYLKFLSKELLFLPKMDWPLLGIIV